MSRYRISVLTLKGHTLTFRVSKYTISDGNFINFVDERTGERKQFHASRCEIVEEDGR